MIEVCTAAEAAARDAETIATGVPSRALMQRAGAMAAAQIARRYRDDLASGVAIFAGPGNNGGDAWVVARALADAGVEVRVHEPLPPKTPDAVAERSLAIGRVQLEPHGAECVVVDGLLGSGASGEPHGVIADAIGRIEAMRARGAHVIALDVPSGVEASTGRATLAVTAELTLSFGTIKRGTLVARERCGEIVVLDIGLVTRATPTELPPPQLVDEAFVASRVQPLAAGAAKGDRKRLAIVGGATGMTGAAILAAQAAMRSGIGMVRLFVDEPSVSVVQIAAYEAMARPWPSGADEVADGISDWAHGVLLGPGLGNTKASRALVERILTTWRGPVVLDADALNVFEGDTVSLASLLRDRPALITPHASEFARLVGRKPQDVLADRFEYPLALARELGAVVLLKGVPTILADPAGRRFVSGRGTPVLGTAGSGDLLAGIAATLVAQRSEALESAACAAWVHGRAGELAQRRASPGGTSARGIPLSDVMRALPRAWRVRSRPARSPVLASLPSLGTT